MNFLQISYPTKMVQYYFFFRATSLWIWPADDTSFGFTYEQKQQSIFQFWMQHNTSKTICQIQVSVQENIETQQHFSAARPTVIFQSFFNNCDTAQSFLLTNKVQVKTAEIPFGKYLNSLT